MTKSLMKPVKWFVVAIVLLGSAFWLIAATGAHAVRASVADAGNSILSDGKGEYIDSVSGEARIWDFDPPGIDHLYFQVSPVNNPQKRKLKLSIPSITNGVETCENGTLQPNQNSHAYSFYDQLAVGQSTADVGENFWGTFRCYDKSGKTGYTVTYDSVSPCIVITHGQYGNPGSDPLEWTHAADASCKAKVEKFVNRRLVGTWVDQSVPFQVVATELP